MTKPNSRAKATKPKPIETEIKLKIDDLRHTRRMLRETGFEVRRPRVFEQNLVLDDANASLRAAGLLLRIRAAGTVITCTLKKKEQTGRHKSREEREFQSSDLTETLAVFEGIGYRESFRYEKYRTEFSRPRERGHIMLDETPMGAFLELEGTGDWIDRTARRLGFTLADYITESYAILWEKWLENIGKPLGDMRFPARV